MLATSRESIQPACDLRLRGPEVRNMKSDYFNRIGRILLTLSFLVGVGLASTVAVQAQYRRDQDPYYRRDRDRNNDRDQDRRYRRDNRNGGLGQGESNCRQQRHPGGLYT